MTITTTRSDAETILTADGRIDTTTAPQLQAELLKSFQGAKTVILDLTKVAYVSSAGLRALLIGQKTATTKGGKFIVQNIHETVMSVLEMSGFDNILNIR